MCKRFFWCFVTDKKNTIGFFFFGFGKMSKRERDIDDEIARVCEEQKKLNSALGLLGIKLGHLKREKDELSKKSSLAIPVEFLVANWEATTKRKCAVEKQIRNLWGNTTDQQHHTLRGESLFDLVCAAVEEYEDSNAAVFLRLPNLDMTILELTKENMKKIDRLNEDPNYIMIFSK